MIVRPRGCTTAGASPDRRSGLSGARGAAVSARQRLVRDSLGIRGQDREAVAGETQYKPGDQIASVEDAISINGICAKCVNPANNFIGRPDLQVKQGDNGVAYGKVVSVQAGDADALPSAYEDLVTGDAAVDSILGDEGEEP